MKKLLALLFAVIFLCSIITTCVAACNHVMVYHSAYTSYYTRPRWTNCGYNHNIHAHTQNCKDLIKVYVCRDCPYSYTKTTTTVMSETCPCAH